MLLVTTEEGCQAKKWLFHHIFMTKNTFIASFGCSFLFILKIFDVPVVLLQVNVCADKNCEKTCISLFKQTVS